MGTRIPLPIAEDRDFEPIFRVQRYRLEPQNNVFALQVETTDLQDGGQSFELSLKLTSTLDRETTSSYSLVLIAEDGDQAFQQGTTLQSYVTKVVFKEVPS